MPLTEGRKSFIL